MHHQISRCILLQHPVRQFGIGVDKSRSQHCLVHRDDGWVSLDLDDNYAQKSRSIHNHELLGHMLTCYE